MSYFLSLDFIGTFFALLSTLLFVQMNNNAWLTGIMSACINAWLYWKKGIYADVGLEMFYLISFFYGWFLWSHDDCISKKHAQGELSSTQWLFVLFITIMNYEIIVTLLETFTDSTVAKMDAITVSLSLTAQWLMNYKIITTWVVWFIVDALCISLYMKKNLPFHTGLMLVYLGMAIAGYLSWAKKNKLSNTHQKIIEETVGKVI